MRYLHLGRPAVVAVEGGEEDAVRNGMDGLLDQNEGLSCDAGAGKPSGIRDIRMGDLYRDLVFLAAEAGDAADVIVHGHIAVGTLSQIIAVAPDLAVLIDAVEADGDLFSSVFFGKGKTQPVPADASRQIAGPAGVFPGKGKADGPVVRKRDLLPCGIVVALIPGVFRFAQIKFPVVVQ